MKAAIVKYNAGNNRSVANALDRLGVGWHLTDDAEALRASDKVIFPGVGEASSAMAYLREKKLDTVIRSLTQPVLGICLGMQLLCEFSEENNTMCLGILPYRVRRFTDDKLKVPHMGWNTITQLGSPLFQDIPEASFAYFVHGFYVEPGTETIAVTDYGKRFSAAMSYKNFYAVQFHPEKSGAAGEIIQRNFISL
ncbi:MAG: imidazole glycerol phosphate synthase subunit HisH [Candidatus Binatia bacterium]